MRLDQFQQPRPDARHPIQSSETSEWAMRLTIGDDDLSQPRTDPRQPGKFGSAGTIDIDPLSSSERTPLPHSAVSLRSGRASRKGTEQLNAARRLIGPGNQVSDCLTGDSQGEQQEESAQFGWRHGEDGKAVGRSDGRRIYARRFGVTA
jgi:hypothetical protein